MLIRRLTELAVHDVYWFRVHLTVACLTILKTPVMIYLTSASPRPKLFPTVRAALSLFSLLRKVMRMTARLFLCNIPFPLFPRQT